MKRIMLLFGIVFSMLGVNASDNVLQTIEIEPVKDTYNIVLVSDKAVDVKKTIQSSNKINLVLKDIRVSKTINTVYNNVSNVDTVMVEQQGSGVNIFFQAENAEAATVTFDSIIPAAAKSVKKETTQLKLNSPIESYAPIYKEDFETAKTSKLFNKLKSASGVTDIKDSLEDAADGDTANKFISWGLLIILAVAVTRLFKKKEPEMRIGLSQQFDNSTVDNHSVLGQNMFPAYQQNFGPKPFTTVNYGLNAYKNGDRNPYETAPMEFHNPKLRNYISQPVAEPVAQAVMTKSAAQPKPAMQAQSRGMTTPVNTAPVNQSNPNVDNLKFLESMTAIYEKSGRHDLAKGLKASLNKNNIK